MSTLISIFLLIIPWVALPLPIPDQTRAIKFVVFDIMCISIILMGLWKGNKFQYKNKYLSVFSILVFLNIIINWYIPLYVQSTEKQMFINIIIMEPMIHFILGLFATFIACSVLEIEDYVKISKAICLSSVFVSIFCIFQVLGFDPLVGIIKYKFPGVFMVTGLLDNPSCVGEYLALTIPFFLYFNRFKYYVGLLLALLVVYFSNSCLAYGATIFGIMVFLGLKYIRKLNIKGILTIGVMLFMLLGFCVFHTEYLVRHVFISRFPVWEQTIKSIKKSPLIGNGLGSFKTQNIRSGGYYFKESHNDWLQIPSELGLLGILSLLGVFMNSLFKFNYKKENTLGFSYLSSAASFFIVMIGGFPIELAAMLSIGLICFWAIEKL